MTRTPKKQRLVLGLSIVLAFLCVIGCVGAVFIINALTPPIPQLEGVETATLGESPLDYRNLVWFDDNRLVVEYHPTADTNAVSGELWTINLDDGDMRRVPLEAHYPECNHYSFGYPSLLPDGRLGYIMACTNSPSFNRYFGAIDLETGERERLIRNHISDLGANGFRQAWNPEMTMVLATTGLPSQIIQIEEYGWSEILDLGFPVAYAPAWSPDGSQIAFVAGNRTKEFVGDYKFPKWVYLMDGNGENITQVLDQEFFAVSGLAWSPDGEQLVLAAEIRQWNDVIDGLWLIDVSTAEFHLIVEGNFHSTSWSPSGQQLAVIRHLGGYGDGAEILIIDLPTPDSTPR